MSIIPDQTAKQDSGKTEWSTLCWDQLEKVARVQMFGNQKYEPNSWKRVDKSRYTEAALRHLIAHVSGERLDSESGMEHLAHLICNAMFIMWMNDQESISATLHCPPLPNYRGIAREALEEDVLQRREASRVAHASMTPEQWESALGKGQAKIDEVVSRGSEAEPIPALIAKLETPEGACTGCYFENRSPSFGAEHGGCGSESCHSGLIFVEKT